MVLGNRYTLNIYTSVAKGTKFWGLTPMFVEVLISKTSWRAFLPAPL